MSEFKQRLELSKRRRFPAGVTLVEAMVVITVSSVILAMAVALAVSLKQADRNLRLHGVQNARLIELAERLRSDIRQGSDVSQPVGGVLLVSTARGGQLRYELTADGCVRSESSSDAAKSRSDLFSIGSADSWTLEEGPPGRRRLLMVTLNRPQPEVATKGLRRTPLMVYAALGADLPPVSAAATSSDSD